MSIEQIIENLEKLASAEEKDDGYCVDMYPRDVFETIKAAAAILRTHQEARPNEPLTLDELREMGDGWPVWVITKDGCCWAFTAMYADGYIRLDTAAGNHLWPDTENIKAVYRRPPKEDKG